MYKTRTTVNKTVEKCTLWKGIVEPGPYIVVVQVEVCDHQGPVEHVSLQDGDEVLSQVQLVDPESIQSQGNWNYNYDLSLSVCYFVGSRKYDKNIGHK